MHAFSFSRLCIGQSRTDFGRMYGTIRSLFFVYLARSDPKLFAFICRRKSPENGRFSARCFRGREPPTSGRAFSNLTTFEHIAKFG